MDDQILQLPKGLHGATLNSSMSDTEKEKVRSKLSTNKLQILFVAPETLTSPFFVHFMQTTSLPPIHFTCIDEVHCISEWSHNFRPAYLRLCGVLRDKLGVKCILGLTATATASTEESIIRHMKLADAAVLRAAPIPSNLHLAVSRVASRRDELVRLLTQHHKMAKGPAIVYCMRQADTEGLAALLRTHRVDADSYHAGMPKQERRRVQLSFMQGKLRVVVATIAFGMGLNKADVRCSFCWQKVYTRGCHCVPTPARL
jgi:ATP-dependent DNA helicase Q4